MRNSSLLALVAFLCACEPSGNSASQAAEPTRPVLPSTTVTPPVLENRDEVIQYRNEAARMLLPPGDSLTIKVYVRIDAQGEVHQPEVHQDVADQRLVGAAISVAQKMHFTPAQSEGQATSVLLTIPVRFVHPAAK